MTERDRARVLELLPMVDILYKDTENYDVALEELCCCVKDKVLHRVDILNRIYDAVEKSADVYNISLQEAEEMGYGYDIDGKSILFLNI